MDVNVSSTTQKKKKMLFQLCCKCSVIPRRSSWHHSVENIISIHVKQKQNGSMRWAISLILASSQENNFAKKLSWFMKIKLIKTLMRLRDRRRLMRWRRMSLLYSGWPWMPMMWSPHRNISIAVFSDLAINSAEGGNSVTYINLLENSLQPTKLEY